MQDQSGFPPDFEELLFAARPRLVRLCAYLTGNADTADDLAQETLVEAWRNAHKLYDLTGLNAWLSGIARNVCLRWGRQQGRELAHSGDALNNDSSDAIDFEVELERDELATLLDRALGLLPPETREALIQRYIQESPLSEIAGRLSISEGTVAVRIHRGKLALKRVLSTQFRDQAIAYGFITSESWQETRLWCPVCGKQRMIGILNTAQGRLGLRCPACYKAYGATMQNSQLPNVIDKAKGFKTALTAMMDWSTQYFYSALARHSVLCIGCNRPIQPSLLGSNVPGSPPNRYHAIDASCSVCCAANSQVIISSALGLPEGQRFWQKHPQIQVLPEQQRVVEGQPALVITFESLTNAARFEAAIGQNTWQVLHAGIEG